MKKYIQSYHMFLPGNALWVKLLLYIVYPLAVMGVVLFGKDEGMIDSMVISSLLIIMIEVILDSELFGSIIAEGTKKLEYLKISYKGKDCLTSGLIGDACRRFGTAAVVQLGSYFLFVRYFSEQQNIGWALLSLSLIFLVEEVIACTIRIIGAIWLNMLVVTLLTTYLMLMIAFLEVDGLNVHCGCLCLLAAFFMVIAVVLAKVNIYQITKWVGGTYHDK